MGRHKKTLDDLPKNWKADILKLYKEGASDVEVICRLDISRDLFYRFLKDEPKFSDTIKKGHILCQTWWEKEGRTNLKNKSFNNGLWYMNMKNRFGWRDRQEGEGIDPGQFLEVFKQIAGAIGQSDTNTG